MSQLSEFEDELLTGFLDGQVSPDEACAVEELLAKNPVAVLRLNALRQLSNDCKSLPVGRLGEDFSSRVIARAREIAIEAGLPSDHHVLSGALNQQLWSSRNKVELSNQNRGWPVRLRWAAGIAAVAASLLLMVSVIRQPGNVPPAPLLSSSDTRVFSSDKQEPTSADGLAELAGNSTDAGKSPIAVAIEESSRDTPAVPSESIQSSGDSKVPPATLVQDKEAVQVLMLLVFDVALSKSAWQDDAFGKVLEGAGIASAAPIVADTQLRKAVEDSLLIVNAPEAVAAGSDALSVALMLVHADAKSLDQAILEVYSRPLDFPEVSFNLAYEQADKSLFNQLRRGTVLAVDQTASRQWARPIVVKEDQFHGVSGAAQFVSAGRRTNLVSSANRGRGWFKLSAESGEASMNPQTETLFVIRQTAGQ